MTTKIINTKKIENIFSKKNKNKKNKPKSKIIIDYREKNSLVISEIKKLEMNYEIKELKIGDYIINNIIIERKTINDFIESMKNKRLLKQIENLKQYKKPLLIIEGLEQEWLYNEKEERIHSNAIRGFILSILLKHNIPIIFSKNPQDTAKYISVIANKKQTNMSLNIKRKTLNKKEQMKFIIEGFPGIGPKTSEKLLDEFKTIKNIINAPEKELEKILRKKTKFFKEIIKENY